MSKTVFVIQKIAWEYNDEYMYTHDGTPGGPVEVHLSREAAELRCRRMNVLNLRGESLYGWHSNDIDTILAAGVTEKSLIETCKQLGIPDAGDDGITVPGDATYEVCEAIYKCLSLLFFEVVEVPLDGGETKAPALQASPPQDPPPPPRNPDEDRLERARSMIL